MAGFGFGWVDNLLSNGTVRSWAAPATGAGMAITNILHAVGAHAVALASVLSVTRFLGVVIAAPLLFGCSGVPPIAAGYARWASRCCSSSSWGRSSNRGTSPGDSSFSRRATRVASTSGCCCSPLWDRSSDCPAADSCWRDSCTRTRLLIALAAAILGGVLVAPMGRWTQWSWPEGEVAPCGSARQRPGGRRRGGRARAPTRPPRSRSRPRAAT